MTNQKSQEKRKGNGGARGINPFVDWSFKRLFANEKNKDLLIGFINLLLEGEEKVEDLEYIDKESLSEDRDKRECVFDVLCTNDKKDKFLVEMQNGKQSFIQNRIIYYTCRLIDKMGEKGDEWMYTLSKAYSICVMDFNYASADLGVRQDAKLCDTRSGKEFSDRIHIIMLQLPQLKWRTMAQCPKLYEKMLYLLKIIKEGMKTIEELKAEVDAANIPNDIKTLFKKMLDTTNVESLTGDEKRQYERDLKHYRDYMSTLDCARNEGRVEGIRATAKSMKAAGIPDGTILECTGLSEEEIAKI